MCASFFVGSSRLRFAVSAVLWRLCEKPVFESSELVFRKDARYRKGAKHLLGSSRPDSSLVYFRHWSEPFVNKFLQASTLVCLSRVDVAFRIRRDAVHAVKLTRLPSSIPEAGQYLERVALNHINFLITPVGNVDVFLLRIF